MKWFGHKQHSMTGQFTRDYVFIAIGPLIVLFLLSLVGGITSTRYVGQLLSRSINDLNTEALVHLRQLGERVIENKARDVAVQIDIYLKAHPDAAMVDLQTDPNFKKIAMQVVGVTGYTCIYESGTGIMRLHPNEKLIDLDMALLSTKLPSWWVIFKPTLKGIERSGYYNWQEKDGSIREKFMTMTPAATRFRGKTLMVAATTYIDEFSTPFTALEKHAGQIKDRYQQFVSREGLYFIGGVMALLLLTFGGVYRLGRRAALRYILPIERLGDSAQKIGKGDWSFTGTGEMLARKDEIGALARTFDRMSRHVKELVTSLEQRVAEQNRIQVALTESEKHYRSLFDGVPIGVYRTTPGGRVLDANPKLIRSLGYPDRESFIALNATQLYTDPADRSNWKTLMDANLDTTTFETRMQTFDGKTIWVENQSQTVRDKDGNIQYYEGSLQNISDRKNTEKTLAENERRLKKLYEESKKAEELYQSLINSSADAIIMYDLEGRVRHVSPVFTQLFGWEIEEVIGKKIPFLPQSERPATMALIHDLITNGTPCRGYGTKRYHKDGTLIDVSISASRYDDHEGKPYGILVSLRDISEHKKLTAQLQHAERMEAIGTLAGGIAHDFNNLMMGIQGNVTLMLLDTDEHSQNFKKLASIEKMIQSGSRLTRHLLGYARKGQYEIRPIDLNLLVQETAETFGRTRREVHIHEELNARPCAIKADRSQIEQVLINIYINAADAMPGGGDLYLETENVTHTDMRNRPYAPKPGRYVRLQITDTGTGISESTIERIFDPFFTTKEMGRGTGLGLASAYGIVKAHGGYIDVNSDIGHGTTFTIYLIASEIRAQEQAPKPEEIVKGRGKILVVDDEEVVAEVATEMLTQAGYSVISTTSGQDALEIYQQKSGEISLVILDMIMPDLSGGDLFDKIKEFNPQARVLLSSGYSLDGQASEIMARGCDGFIQKPFNLEQVTHKITEIIPSAA
ncbi:MAG: PAS/PAC sensor hybrid histidine kinase [Olavius algarvensis Delta 4 endosymbiont]|nr:MAG: PAS/PAC sensor hybrid histidine kinase [Olavius algarvensis Delta 4 endosymbiont]